MQEVHVAIIGASGSGKTSLLQVLNGQIIKGSVEPIRLHVQEYDSFQPEIAPQFDLALITYALEGEELLLKESDAIILARCVQKAYPAKDKVLLVATKYDLIPRDLSYPELRVRDVASRVAFRDELQYRAISAMTSEGVSDLTSKISSIVQPPPCTTARWNILALIYAVWASILDIIASAFALRPPSHVNRDTPDPPLEIAEETITEQAQEEKRVAREAQGDKAWFVVSSGSTPVRHITDTIVAKRGSPWERHNMSFVRKYTNIPVPQPRYPHMESWLLMDKIEGRSLDECWDSLSFFMQFRIACTMRLYIRQLQQLMSDVPGLPDGYVDGPAFNFSSHGPFQNPDRLRLFCEMVAQEGWSYRLRFRKDQHLHTKPPVMGGAWSLSYTHGDLNLENLMLSKDNVLWVIDWAYSGFLPPWTETAYMALLEEFQPPSWNRWRRFIAGNYPHYEHLWGLAYDYFDRGWF